MSSWSAWPEPAVDGGVEGGVAMASVVRRLAMCEVLDVNSNLFAKSNLPDVSNFISLTFFISVCFLRVVPRPL
jgi:hypothetical protein